MLDVDRFGNLGLNVTADEIAALGVGHGDQVEIGLALTPYFAVVAETYADASRGELILYEDSYGHWSIAINGGSAAALTESASGDQVRIRMPADVSQPPEPARTVRLQWRGPDLNRRHHGFQPCALPAELPRLEPSQWIAAAKLAFGNERRLDGAHNERRPRLCRGRE